MYYNVKNYKRFEQNRINDQIFIVRFDFTLYHKRSDLSHVESIKKTMLLPAIDVLCATIDKAFSL